MKKRRSNLIYRLGIALPIFTIKKNQKVIWVHAVSVGEAKAASVLVDKLKQEIPEAYIIVSSVTETGHKEAKRSIKNADKHIFLPFDFSWIVKRYFSKTKPYAVFFVETDFWYHFLKYAKRYGAKTYLVSGKVSEKSANRYLRFSFFSKKFFSFFDILCVQNEDYKKRFFSFTGKKEIFVTGNLKYDLVNAMPSQEQRDVYRKKFGFSREDLVVTIASTHDPEERLLIDVLENLWKKFPKLKILLAPRHPERFEKVQALLEEEKVLFVSYSSIPQKVNSKNRVVLIDTMGLLNICFSISSLAIVCGSFTDKVGGHNILEPVFLNVPVFFGPYMFGQKDLREVVLRAKCGKEVAVSEIENVLEVYFLNSDLRKSMYKNCEILKKTLGGSIFKIWAVLDL